MSKVNEADEVLIKSNIELTIKLENMTKQLKAARGNVCESCVSTTEMVDSMDYQIEELTEKVAAKDRMLEGFRKHINRLEYDLTLADSYSTMSSHLRAKEVLKASKNLGSIPKIIMVDN